MSTRTPTPATVDDAPSSDGLDGSSGVRVTRKPERLWSTPRVVATQLAILATVLFAWEYVPKIDGLAEVSPVFDPFFVSSPSMIFSRLIDLAAGSDGQPLIWPYLRDTLLATGVGVTVGIVLGAFFGLVLSNSRNGQRVTRPFITVLNATPRVALIPIFVILAGPSLTASILTAIITVFFLVFYNAFMGGSSIPASSIDNAVLLGATKGEVMRSVRLPYVLVWTFASLPNSITFGLVAVVTAEVLTGRMGMGQLMYVSISSINSTLTFCVVVILAIVGVVLVTAADAIQRRVLHWWTEQ